MVNYPPQGTGGGGGGGVHNALTGRDAVATHPSESVGVLSPYSMNPRDVGKNWTDTGVI